MVLVKHTPYMAGYKGPLSSKILAEEETVVVDEVPLLHLKENDQCFEMEIDVPGLKAKNYNIEIKDGAMVISSETAPMNKSEGKLRLVIERKHEPAKVEDGNNYNQTDHFTVL